MKTNGSILAAFPRTIADLYGHPDFAPFPQSSDDWINDPDRMARCHEAAEHGCDGSTPAEVIQDWRDFLAHQFDVAESNLDGDEADLETLESLRGALEAELDACEARHETAGTLHEEIG